MIPSLAIILTLIVCGKTNMFRVILEAHHFMVIEACICKQSDLKMSGQNPTKAQIGRKINFGIFSHSFFTFRRDNWEK